MSERRPYWVGGEARVGATGLTVRDKWTGEVLDEVSLAGPAEVDEAIGVAYGARRAMERLRPYERRDVLMGCVGAFGGRRDELAEVLAGEAGKPLRDARGEVARLIDTFRVAAEEATRVGGEVMPLEISERARGYRGMWKRVPVGVCGFITPFNFPLNLVAHKVAPAIAAGCPFVLKPASATPLGALIVGEVLAAQGLPAGAFSVLPARGADAEALATDRRIRKFSFTGSDEVGLALQAKSRGQRVTLELGGNAPCVVDETADLDDAAERILVGAFAQCGQSCISVQRIIVVEAVYDGLRERLVQRVAALRAGDPRDEANVCGPLIDRAEAKRVEAWIAAAVDAGARVLCGGQREGATVQPCLVEDVPVGQPLLDEEVFGPVAVLQRVEDFDAALAEAGRTRFGLQAGVFTRDLHRAMRAWDELAFGGVLVGEVPSWRVDHMPYGGVGDSGIGREGVRWAIDEMTEPRLLVLRTPPETR